MTVVPSTIWRMLAQRNKGKELPKGLDAAWHSGLGRTSRLKYRTGRFLTMAKKVLQWEKHFTDMADGKLREEAAEFRVLFRCGRDKQEDLPRAFALVREAAFRQIGEKPFHVQVAGALAIEAGCITEMATGEGKTLAATMPAVIAGWRGKGCHIITVNDYLAERDAKWMSEIYSFCGVKVGYLTDKMEQPQRREGYQADITYCTNKAVTADFLRDRLALGRLRSLPEALLASIVDGSTSGTDRVVQRGLNYAIIDEADSVLIDEAVTPVIIAGEGPNPEQAEAYKRAYDLACMLEPDKHYKTNFRYHEAELNNAGKMRLVELTSGLGGIWTGQRRSEELVVQALTAKEFYMEGKQYVIQEGKVIIVDEFTGRLMPDREWRDGLHQAVSAKEDVDVKSPKDTYARVSYQRFFRLYRTLSGMTGTANEAKSEFWQIYGRPTVVIPTNEPCIRKHLPDRVYATEDAKWAAIVEEIALIHKTGRPLLVGTRSVRASVHLSELLERKGLEHQVLNAIRHAEEANIVAEAGQPGKITVATNMAGRGTDIKLGRGVAEQGGLHVLTTERHEAGRVDRQLFGRCARQGDPGIAQAFVSLEDELPRRHNQLFCASMRRRYGDTDNEISSRLTRSVCDIAQRRAEKQALRQRKAVLRTDDWLDRYLGFTGVEK